MSEQEEERSIFITQNTFKDIMDTSIDSSCLAGAADFFMNGSVDLECLGKQTETP